MNHDRQSTSVVVLRRVLGVCVFSATLASVWLSVGSQSWTALEYSAASDWSFLLDNTNNKDNNNNSTLSSPAVASETVENRTKNMEQKSHLMNDSPRTRLNSSHHLHQMSSQENQNQPPATSQQQGQTDTTTHTRKTFLTAPLCPGCHHAKVGKRSTCGNEIVPFLRRYNGDAVNKTQQAVAFVAQKFPKECGFCQPPCTYSNSNNTHHTTTTAATGIYTSFDQAAPTIRQARTHYLTTVPDDFRILHASQAKRNLTHYAYNPQHQFPQRLHLFEFNPSIVQLPPSYQQALQQDLGNSTVTYLASYRVSAVDSMCFAHDTRAQVYGGGDWDVINNDVPETDFLGLAVLDHDLHIVADGVFSVKLFDSKRQCWFGDCANTDLHERQRRYRRFVKELQKSMITHPNHLDYRLFSLRGQVYVAMGIFMVPLYLSAPNTTKSEMMHIREKMNPAIPNNTTNLFPLPQVFPGTAQLQAWMRNMGSCVVHGGNHWGSKNLQYFVNETNHTLVDIFPSANPRDIREANLDAKCQSQQVPNPPNISRFRNPRPSFGTMDELQFPTYKNMFMGDRGSACCVDIQHPETGEHYFLGISHPKTPFPGRQLPKNVTPNTYLSRFFAMQKRSPYEMVAKTGKFCLGFAQESDNSNHPLWNIQNHPETYIPLYWANDTLNCPRLHFVGSLIDKAGYPSKVIVAYGVSDCLSRFVEMDKAEIAQLLWNPMGAAKGLVPAPDY